MHNQYKKLLEIFNIFFHSVLEIQHFTLIAHLSLDYISLDHMWLMAALMDTAGLSHWAGS